MATNVGLLIDNAIAAYAANASYQSHASRSEALAFIGACETLLGLRPLAAGRSEMGTLSFTELTAAINRANTWLAMNPQNKAKGRLASFRDYRDRAINPPLYGTDT